MCGTHRATSAVARVSWGRVTATDRHMKGANSKETLWGVNSHHQKKKTTKNLLPLPLWAGLIFPWVTFTWKHTASRASRRPIRKNTALASKAFSNKGARSVNHTPLRTSSVPSIPSPPPPPPVSQPGFGHSVTAVRAAGQRATSHRPLQNKCQRAGVEHTR